MKFGTKMKIPGYVSYNKNRKEKSHGGIATSIIEGEAAECLKITEGNDNNEFLITRHAQFIPPINVINVYSEQENRTASDIIKEHWNEVLEEIIKLKLSGKI